MKRSVFFFLALLLVAAPSLQADDNISKVQRSLKAGGFYFGEINGRYDSDTAAGVTRYQIRNGLPITGKLDAQTSYALGVTETKPETPTPRFGEDVWRYLRKSDQEHIKRMIAEDARKTERSKPRPPAIQQPSVSPPAAGKNNTSADYNRERLRDYIAAFVLAGLDPQVGAETEFFAERVNYFGKPGVTRETIRRDLKRYNDHWPRRAFTLAGELEIVSANNNLTVTFPLRYDLRNASKHSTGKVLKTLVLARTGSDDLEIVSVNEKKSK